MRSFLTALNPFVKGVLGAIVGSMIFFILMHVYQDHLVFHELVGAWNTHAPKLMALPPPQQ